MRILFVLSGSTPYGGANKSFLSLCRGMKRKGVDICVVSPQSGGICSVVESLGIKVLSFPYRFCVYPPANSLRKLLLYLPRLGYSWFLNVLAKTKLLKVAKSYKPDIIYTNVGVIGIGYSVARKLGIFHIYHLREYQDRDFNLHIIPSLGSFRKSLCQKGNYSICITKGVMEHFGLVPDNACVIYNGIYDRLMPLKDKVQKGNYFLFAGRLEETKGLSIVVESFILFCSEFPTQKVELWIAGDSRNYKYIGEIKDRISSVNLQNRVRFLGFRDDVEELMRSAKAVLFASRFEGFGRVVAESMLCKTLVIGRNTAGVKEQFDNGLKYVGSEIGLRFETRADLVECMKKSVCMSQEEYNSIIAGAFKTVCKFYSVQVYVDSIYSLCLKLSQRSGN